VIHPLTSAVANNMPTVRQPGPFVSLNTVPELARIIKPVMLRPSDSLQITPNISTGRQSELDRVQGELRRQSELRKQMEEQIAAMGDKVTSIVEGVQARHHDLEKLQDKLREQATERDRIEKEIKGLENQIQQTTDACQI
jgi:septal ring factor EnvC (AmiA/AmiB activator)